MFAVLHFPQFAMQAVLRHEPGLWACPVALLDPSMTVPRVVDATPVARHAGITDGLTAPQALARCRSLQVRHRSPENEATATEGVIQTAYAFSPNLEATGPGTITMDLRGLAALRTKEGEAAPDDAEFVARYTDWAQPLMTALEALGLRVRVGIGPTPNVAQHAARWADREAPAVAGAPSSAGGSSVFVVTNSTEFVAALPPAALSPSTEVLEVLRRWGIRTVGELLALGQAELADRFGLEALALFAAASVSTIRPLRWVQPAERFEESHSFETEIETLEPLLFLLRRFVDGLGERLKGLGMAAGSLTLRLSLSSGGVMERVLRLPQPTHRPDVLFRMLHTHLETLRTESPLIAVALRAEPARPPQRQYSLFEAALRDPHQFQETLARLVALLGAERVGTPHRENTHRADSFRMVPPDFENGTPAVADEVPLLLRSVPIRRLRPPLPAGVDCEGTINAMKPEIHVLPSHGWEAAFPNGPMVNIAELLEPVLNPAPKTVAGSKENPQTSARTTAAPVSSTGQEMASAERKMRGLPDEPCGEARRPVSLRCSMVQGRLRVVLGPWRTSGRWWDDQRWARDEWDVVTLRGDVLRLVRTGSSWQVEGVLD